MKFEITPIGVIHSPYKTRSEAPHQGYGSEAIAEIEIFEKYEEGATDIENLSNILVVYYFHQSKGYSLMVMTPWDDVRHGVFATRSPDRPNSLGVCTAKLISKEGRFLKVKGLDALDGSPLIDIKPLITGDEFSTED